MIALCLGGAQNVWADLEAACALICDRPRLIVACNHVGLKYMGRLDAWVSLHPEYLNVWLKERAQAGGNTDHRTFTDRPIRNLEVEIVKSRWFGSSGLYAAQVALDALGCSGAILCGIPMDDGAGHIHWGRWESALHYRKGLEKIAASGEAIRGVRSMSGYTYELFGGPDREWLDRLAKRAAA